MSGALIGPSHKQSAKRVELHHNLGRSAWCPTEEQLDPEFDQISADIETGRRMSSSQGTTTPAPPPDIIQRLGLGLLVATLAPAYEGLQEEIGEYAQFVDPPLYAHSQPSLQS